MVEVETIDPAVNRWHRVGGQEGGTVTSIAMASHSEGRRLFSAPCPVSFCPTTTARPGVFPTPS